MPDLENFGEFQGAINATGGREGAHWLGDLEPSKLFAQFLTESVQAFDAGPSGPVPRVENGLPVYKDEVHIKVFMPGGDITSRRAREEDKHVYGAAWEAFKRGNVDDPGGYPLKEWAVATPAVIATLNAANVFNIEGLAALSDAHCEKIGNIAFLYREKALKFLSQAEGENRELEEMRGQNADMAEQLKAMQQQIDRMKPRKPGRPVGSKTKVVKNDPVDHDPGDDGPAEPADA